MSVTPREAELSLKLAEVKAKAQGQRMTEHSQPLKEARELADHLNQTRPGSNPIPHDGARMLRILADLVEQQNRSITEYAVAFGVYKAAADGLGDMQQFLTRMATAAVNAELRAACVTCGKAIEDVLYAVMRTHPNDNDSAVWIGLRAAGHLASRAVKLADEPVVPAEPPPLIAVEMQVVHLEHSECEWECRLADRTGARSTAVYESASSAMLGGNAWLSLLGKQLGVPLEANWKGGG